MILGMDEVENYLARLEAPQRTALQRVRDIIKRTTPDATQQISYGMPAFKYKGKYLIGYAAFKNHMSVFPGSEVIEELAEQLKSFTTAKGTIQFSLENELPEDLLTDIIRRRMRDIENKR